MKTSLKRSTQLPFLLSILLAALALVACGPPEEGGPMGGGEPVELDEQLTLESCTTQIDADVPAFYQKYFRCVDISMSGDSVVITTKGLPPHQSYYYGEGSPNFAEFDYSRGGEYRPNPNAIGETEVSFTIPNNPTPRGLTINDALVDGVVNTDSNEFSMGPAGVALDSVFIFNPLAAPGDDIEDEKYTFDSYAGHPAGTTYHYHTVTPGPLEVMQAIGLTTSTTPGSADVEVYGIMCDGTLVLGCTELDGTQPAGDDLDAQNGHSHDLIDEEGTSHFLDRYHTHVCPGVFTNHSFTPEIQFYDACSGGGLEAMGGGPP